MVTDAVYITIGVFSGYYFFKRVLGLNWPASLLGTVFFALNGFTAQRIAVGHVGYINFYLIPLLLVALCDRSIPWKFSALLVGLLTASMIYSSGYVIVVVLGLSLLVTLPVIYIYNSRLISWKSVFQILALGGLTALLLSASKLAAVYAFMRYFPRLIQDDSSIGFLAGLASLGYQLLGTMNLAPIFWAWGRDINQIPQFMLDSSGSTYGYFWEFDMSISPVVLLITITGLVGLLLSPQKNSRRLTENRKWLAWLFLLFAIWLTIEFALGKGLFYPALQNLPILGSLHVNMRFTSALILPLALVAAIFYHRWSSRWPTKIALPIFLTVNLLTLLPFGAYFLIRGYTDLSDYDLTEMLVTDRQIEAGAPFKIKEIEELPNNSRALKRGVSNLHPFNALFGYDLRYFRTELKEGSIWEVSGGYYNLTNPSGFVFPELNGTRPFERIRVDDEANMRLFAMHLQPNWKIPAYQRALDWLSGLTFLGVMAALIGYFLRAGFKWVTHRKPV
jgi:hypothetical protein